MMALYDHEIYSGKVEGIFEYNKFRDMMESLFDEKPSEPLPGYKFLVYNLHKPKITLTYIQADDSVSIYAAGRIDHVLDLEKRINERRFKATI